MYVAHSSFTVDAAAKYFDSKDGGEYDDLPALIPGYQPGRGHRGWCRSSCKITILFLVRNTLYMMRMEEGIDNTLPSS